MHPKKLLFLVFCLSLSLLGPACLAAELRVAGLVAPGALGGPASRSVQDVKRFLGKSLAPWLPGAGRSGLPDRVGRHVQSDAPGPAGEPVRALEQQLQQLMADARRQQTELVQVHRQLVAAEGANRWLPWLMLGWLATAGGLVWFALKSRRLQRDLERREWVQAAEEQEQRVSVMDAPPPPAPGITTEQPLLSKAPPSASMPLGRPGLNLTQPGPLTGPEAPTFDGSPSRSHTPLRVNDSSMGTGIPPRAVSVDELMDLDQQVDFFLVLGQAQSAVDLLLGHVRSTGGSNAQPYFRLLEIYRDEGDEEDYERTRERFNQRFNGFAPPWSGDLNEGRSLEAYTELIDQIQAYWSQPDRVIALIEELMPRSVQSEPLDLPAYRELLLLHAVANDLRDGSVSGTAPAPVALDVPEPVRAWVETPDPLEKTQAPEPVALPSGPVTMVDILLPLDEPEAGLDITAPMPRNSARSSAQAMLAEWVYARATTKLARPAGAVDTGNTAWPPQSSVHGTLDLDLSDFVPAPREFTRPAAFTDVDMRRDSHPSDLAAFDDAEPPPPGGSNRQS